MKLTKLTLGFENCDAVDIPSELIQHFHITGIENGFALAGNSEIVPNDVCRSMCLVLRPEAAKLRTLFGGESSLLGDRLKGRDIVSVSLSCESGEAVFCYVPWDEQDQYINRNLRLIQDEDTGVTTIRIRSEG